MSGLNELSFPKDYYCDEVREGFYVSETMKRYWAAQLQVLSEIDKICCRHNLNWYADCGTLIGVVRHKGYIPWDDDLDIAMMRTDYERFLEYAREELPQGYCILSSHDNKEYYYPFGRITNSRNIDLRKDFLAANHGCPFVVGVDIFPLDNVYANPEKEEERVGRGREVFYTLSGILHNTLSETEINKRLRKIEKDNDVAFSKGDLRRQLLLLFEKISTECGDDSSKEIVRLYSWVKDRTITFLRDSYSAWKNAPFEATMLRIPEGYDAILRNIYGDYMKIVRGGSVHLYPVYRGLETLYREKTGRNPNRYYFKKENFAPVVKKTFKQQQLEMLERMRAIHSRLKAIAETNHNADMTTFLQACQKAAVSIGNALEGRFGEGLEAVSCLEQYCEKVYEVSCQWTEGSVAELDDCIITAADEIERLFDGAKKDILFLPCRANWWDSMKALFLKYDEDTTNTVSVIPLPYNFIDNFGNVGETLRDIQEFEGMPELRENLTNFDNYDLEKRHPDAIVIQYPYDGSGGMMTIPDMLFSENLSRYTDELIYVPFLDPLPPESKKDVAFEAVRELVEQPAVFCADTIIVGSEGLRECYITLLVEMTGDEFRDYWTNKICSMQKEKVHE